MYCCASHERKRSQRGYTSRTGTVARRTSESVPGEDTHLATYITINKPNPRKQVLLTGHGHLSHHNAGTTKAAGTTRHLELQIAAYHSYIFQQRFIVRPDGAAENAGFRVIPVSISSQENVNDFKPTPSDSENAQRIVGRLLELNKKFEKNSKKFGVAAVSDYPTEWTMQY